MMDLILSSIPLWVWLVIGMLITAPLLYFFGPIWNGLPNWIKYPAYAIAALLGVFIAGQRKGHLAAKSRQEELDRHAVQDRKRIHDNVAKLNPVDTDQQLGRWMRD